MPTNSIGESTPLCRPISSALEVSPTPSPLPPAPSAMPTDRLDLNSSGPKAEGNTLVGTLLAKASSALKSMLISGAAWVADALPFLRDEKAAKALTSFEQLRKRYGEDPEWQKLESLVGIPSAPAPSTRGLLAEADTRIQELQSRLNQATAQKISALALGQAAPSTEGVQEKLSAELAKREQLYATPPQDPQLKAIWDEMEVGDVILTASGPNSAVGVLTAGDEVTHAALCIKKGPPPVFIEAVGITGDMKDATSNQVREADFWTFFEGTERNAADPKKARYAYHVLRPNYGKTTEERMANLQKVVGYAEAQIGKPYDYFFDGCDSRAFFCSELVRKSFENSPIKLESNRIVDSTTEQQQQAIAQGIVDSMRCLRDNYKLSDQDLYELSTKPAKLTEMVAVEILGMANDDNTYETFRQKFDRLMGQLTPIMQPETREKFVGMADFLRRIAQNGAFDRKNLGDILDFGLSRMGAKLPEGAMRSFILGQGASQIRMFSGLVRFSGPKLANDDYVDNLGREIEDGYWKRSTSPQDLLFVPADGENITEKLHFQPDGTVLTET